MEDEEGDGGGGRERIVYTQYICNYIWSLLHTHVIEIRLLVSTSVSSGLFLENCSYPSIGLSRDPQQFLSLETETDF